MEILPQSETFAWRTAISQQDLNDYRWERQRQQDELEAQTGGHAGDLSLYHENEGKPLITLRDYLKGKGGEQQRWQEEQDEWNRLNPLSPFVPPGARRTPNEPMPRHPAWDPGVDTGMIDLPEPSREGRRCVRRRDRR